jgi:hypothetical protein
MAKVDSMERAAKLGAAVVIAGDDRGALEQLFKDIRRFFE